jgi:hypothetical protein
MIIALSQNKPPTGTLGEDCSAFVREPARRTMAQESGEIDLMRLLIAEIWFGISMKAAREMYGRSYFSLGMMEKFALDQTVASMVAAHYFAMGPQLPRPLSRQIAGFQPEASSRQGSTPSRSRSDLPF